MLEKSKSSFSIEQLDDLTEFGNNPAYLDSYIHKLEVVTRNTANNTDGALAVYIRFNPELTSPTSGLFWSRTGENNTFEALTPTDLSLYDEDDDEHVGWYYKPIKSKTAMWLAISAPVSEIDAASIRLYYQTIFSILIMSLLFIVLTVFITKGLISQRMKLDNLLEVLKQPIKTYSNIWTTLIVWLIVMA